MSFDDDYTEEYTDEDAGTALLILNHLCASAFPPRNSSKDSKYESEMSWEPVREWIRNHSEEETRQAALLRGDSNLTALHFCCRNGSNVADIIDIFLRVASETVAWKDSFGWLPIHYACACGADSTVVGKLAEKFPESMLIVDKRGLTPLHFSLGNQDPNKWASPTVVAILSSSGAASMPDNLGMLPLHYACAYGATEEALYVLTDAYPDAIRAKDVENRLPLHFALSNAGRNASPGAVRHLLSLDRALANGINGGPPPLRTLLEFAVALRKSGTDEEKSNCAKCLEQLLNAKPIPTADFFSALQALPFWLREKVVVMPSVQVLLNDKISQRFPTFSLMCDFFCLILVIIFYSIDVIKSILLRDDGNPSTNSLETKYLVPLYVGAGYFFLREVTKMLSLLSLKSFYIWLFRPSSLLNVAFIGLVLFWAIRMQTGTGDNDLFRYGTAFSVVILWLQVLAFLRNILLDFAVFVTGLIHVVQRLVAFLTALVIILIAFSQMFLTVFRQTAYCNDRPDQGLMANEWCFEDYRPYCEFGTSFLSVYTMLLGEVDEENFKASRVATFLFCIFMFAVVILLANVLIAIVTDSYKVIQNQRAAVVFWSNRLDFVAEMDAMANGPWKKRLKMCCRLGGNQDEDIAPQGSTFGKELWEQLMDLFDDDTEEDSLSTSLLRIFAALVIIPSWIGIGLVTAGFLWPPQVREAIFRRAVSRHSSDSAEEDELRKTQVALLQKEVSELREGLAQELAVDRTQVVQMKSQIDHRRTEIDCEMKNIKRIVMMLFEQQNIAG